MYANFRTSVLHMIVIKWIVIPPKRVVYWMLSLPKPVVVWVLRRTLANPDLRARALSVLVDYPRLYQYLRELAARAGLSENTIATASAPSISEEEIRTLSPLASRIYADLKQAIDTKKS